MATTEATWMKFGRTKVVFTPDLWSKWLARLNTPPDPQLVNGIAEMRRLLQARCLGEVRESLDDTGSFRNFVTRTFGTLK